jgi:1-acyl-sn-glycerol-3-phosphate acyltransferase
MLQRRTGGTANAEDMRLSPVARAVRRWLLGWFDRGGWDVEGIAPPVPKFVVMGAPHTSNWDFLVFLGTFERFGIRPRFIGKHSLFRWPAGNFMRALGGVPVDRSARGDMVAQMVALFAHENEFALVIAAEGTRQPTSRWRTGFYRIAVEAGVPIQCAGPDYERKRGIFGPLIWPSGDFETDMATAYAFFRTLKPLHPERVLFPDGYGMDGGAAAA